MEQTPTSELIRKTAKRLFAQHGYDGVSMRILAKESGVGLSSIYHFFKDKDLLLEQIYLETNTQLGIERRALASQPSAEKMLAQLIEFQFKHIEDIVYVLKYYLHFRSSFASLPTKTLPPKSVLHVEEVIRKGRHLGEFTISENAIPASAKVLTHTINGYLLEYYPEVPTRKELEEIVKNIVSFSKVGLQNQ